MSLGSRVGLGAAVVFGYAGVAFAHDDGFESGQAIVELAPGATIEEFHAAFGTTTIDAMDERPIYLVELPDGTDEEAFEVAVELSPLVVKAHLDYLGTPSDPGSDTRSIYTGASAELFVNAEPFGMIGVSEPPVGWRQVVVGVIDGGIDASHPELAGRVLTGYNFVTDTVGTPDVANGTDSNANGYPDETFGHGTFVAGLIAAVAPEAKILPLQVMDSDGRATSFRLARAIFAAADAGVDILNISLSSSRGSELVEQALEEANRQGVIVVSSAGNTGVRETRFPAGFDVEMLLGVAATDNNDVLASFSTFGNGVALTAPGVDLVSLLPAGWPADAPEPGHGYASASGTSFAAPLVTGALAVAKSRCTLASNEALVQALCATATDLAASDPTHAVDLGAGRLDLQGLLDALYVCPADLSRDGVLNLDDVSLFADGFIRGEDSGDLNGDGRLNLDDIHVFVLAFRGGC